MSEAKPKQQTQPKPATEKPAEDKALVEIKKRVTSLAKEYHVSEDQLKLAMKTVAKGATMDEFAMFMHIAKTSGLDPFKKEIYFYKVKNNVQGGEDVVIVTSRDGFLSIAQKTGELTGINSSSIREKDEFTLTYLPNGNIEIYHKITTANKELRGKILGAWARVQRKGFSEPTVVYVDFDTYDKGMRGWKTHPDAMIVKCGEAIALKKLFGISGLTSMEEMGFDPAAQEAQEPENVIFNTIIKTIESQKDPKKKVELAEREIKENKSLTDEQREQLRKYTVIDGEVVK